MTRDPSPIPRSKASLMTAVLASVLLNLLLAVAFFLTTISAPRQAPPTIVASSVSIPIPEPTIESPPAGHRSSEMPQAGGAATVPVFTVATHSAASISRHVPDFPSVDGGFVGSDGIGGSPGFGTGPGFGSSFGSGFGLGDVGTGSGSGTSMKVGKLSVKAQRLGVVLDISGSMKEKLPSVKKEIRSAFHTAKTVDVEGCRIDWKGEEQGGIPSNRLRANADSVIEAVEMLVAEGKVDAIYWFSDLQDGETEKGLARLQELLQIEKGRGRAVRFYIRSLDAKPSAQLAAIVKASGGSVQVGD